jgi:hypothetical protein
MCAQLCQALDQLMDEGAEIRSEEHLSVHAREG